MWAREVAARLGRLGLGGLHRARRQRLEQILDDVLGRQPLDQLGLLQPHRGLVRHRAQELGVLVVEGAAVRNAGEDPELLVPRRQRCDKQLVLHRAGAPAAHEVEQLRRASGARARLRRIRTREVQLVGLGVDPPNLARVGAEQLASAARDGVVEVLAQRHRRERLAQLRERRERLDPPARALEELRVVDRARRQRRRVHEKVEHSVVELARRLRMENHHTQHVAVAGHHRHGHHRLEALLLELRHVLHARVIECVVANELGRLGSGDPPRQALVQSPGELADQVRIARRCRPQHQTLIVNEIDEARVATRRVGRDLDDAVQNTIEVQRGRDRLDDGVERLVFALYAGQSVAAARHR